jgi:hypothetical protein
VGKRAQAPEGTGSQGQHPKPSAHPSARRRPSGRKPGPAPSFQNFGGLLTGLIRHCFPDFNTWLQALPDPRWIELCVYLGRHIWWQIILTFLLRAGSRNAFDALRNSGQLPENVLQLCQQLWDEQRLGKRRTVTCSQNAQRHAGRVSVQAVSQILLKMVRRLMQMRLLDSGRLFGHWWLIAVDGTLQDRGRKTRKQPARYRYIVTASLVGPFGLCLPFLTEFEDVSNPTREKKDCELGAFLRLAKRLHAEFPHLAICLLLDGLYPVQRVFDLCRAYQWRFIATLREGRQPTAFDEAVQTMMMEPTAVRTAQRKVEDGWAEQTLRWTCDIPFGEHTFNVVFSAEIAPHATALNVVVTNLRLDPERVLPIANQGARQRNRIEELFNVEKNGGFGLEHTFCADLQAAQNYHLMMQVAFILSQLLCDGLLKRLMQACRKVTDRVLIDLLRTSLLTTPLDPDLPPIGQLRFCSSA